MLTNTASAAPACLLGDNFYVKYAHFKAVYLTVFCQNISFLEEEKVESIEKKKSVKEYGLATSNCQAFLACFEACLTRVLVWYQKGTKLQNSLIQLPTTVLATILYKEFHLKPRLLSQ